VTAAVHLLHRGPRAHPTQRTMIRQNKPRDQRRNDGCDTKGAIGANGVQAVIRR
jgi:hypothetical protein